MNYFKYLCNRAKQNIVNPHFAACLMTSVAALSNDGFTIRLTVSLWVLLKASRRANALSTFVPVRRTTRGTLILT